MNRAIARSKFLIGVFAASCFLGLPGAGAQEAGSQTVSQAGGAANSPRDESQARGLTSEAAPDAAFGAGAAIENQTAGSGASSVWTAGRQSFGSVGTSVWEARPQTFIAPATLGWTPAGTGSFGMHSQPGGIWVSNEGSVPSTSPATGSGFAPLSTAKRLSSHPVSRGTLSPERGTAVGKTRSFSSVVRHGSTLTGGAARGAAGRTGSQKPTGPFTHGASGSGGFTGFGATAKKAAPKSDTPAGDF